MTEIREVAEDELERWITTARAALDEADTAEGYLDWKRQARETIWLLASAAGRDVGTAIGVGGWHSPEGVARAEIRVVADARAGGVGSALLAELSAWARPLGYHELTAPVKEDDPASLAWAERRGFVEVGRNRCQAASSPHLPYAIRAASSQTRPATAPVVQIQMMMGLIAGRAFDTAWTATACAGRTSNVTDAEDACGRLDAMNGSARQRSAIARQYASRAAGAPTRKSASAAAATETMIRIWLL